MAEPVEIDHLPVQLTAAQQKKWDSGDKGRREVRKQIRQERLAVQYTDNEIANMPKGESFNEVMGE